MLILREGFNCISAKFLEGFDIGTIKDSFISADASIPIPEIRARILCEVLQDRRSTAAMELAGLLLLRGIKQAATTIYFVAGFGKPNSDLSWAVFTQQHIECLMAQINSNDSETWAAKALACICSARTDLAATVQRIADTEKGIRKGILAYCATPTNLQPVYDALANLIAMPAAARNKEPIDLLEQIDFEWLGHESLIVQLLKLQDVVLA